MILCVRHLSEDQARSALDRRHAIEQLHQASVGSGLVQWLCLSPRDDGIVLVEHRVEDVGTAEFVEVYEFPAADPGEEHGEGRVIATFGDSAEALAVSIEHGARPDRWVNQGKVQDEYADTKAW